MNNSHHVIPFAIAFVLLCSSQLSASEVEDFLRLDTTPKFDTTSSEAVLLRYRFKTGQILKMHMDMNMTMVMRNAGLKVEIKQTMGFEAKIAITEVDSDGNMSAVMKMTRFRMKVAGPREVAFDSNDTENVNPAFAPLSAMINVGIPCKMSPVGELLETDLEPMRLAMRRAGDAAFAKQFESTADKMFEGAFVQLAKEPVKTGESYKAGTVLQDKTKMHMSYKIGAISGDKKMVVLEPIAKMEIKPDAFPGAEVEIKSNQVSGWVLFDLDKGYPAQANARVYALMVIKADGQTVTIDARSSMTTKTTLSE